MTGTENVLAACAEAGVVRFVHCGTEASLMAGAPLVQIDETAPLRPDSRAPYPATKAKAEQAVRAAAREVAATVGSLPIYSIFTLFFFSIGSPGHLQKVRFG